MKVLIFLILLLYIINSPSPFKDINFEEIKKKEIEEEKRFQKNRRLNNGKVFYKNADSIMTIYNDGTIETMSVSVKAEGGELKYFYIPPVSNILEILSCKLKIKDDKGIDIPIDSNINYCSTSSGKIKVEIDLQENYEILVNAKIKGYYTTTGTSFLYQIVSIHTPYTFDNKTYCKYIFNIDSNAVNIGLEYGNFQIYNDSAYIYDGLCPNNYLSDLVKLTARQLTWNSYIKVTAEMGDEKPRYLLISAPLDFLEGTNFNITQDLSYSPIRNKDSFITNYNFYVLNYYNFENTSNYYFIKNITFSSSPNFWNITDEAIKNELKNTSTEQSISLVKQILANNTSDNPDYYKIGKWIYKNIKYNSNHNTASNVDDIIEKREGVCHNFTLLYNALLNSIGIRALYAAGNDIQDLTSLRKGNHAWTVAEINGKWIGLDATWNLFYGKLPQCHLFHKFGGMFDVTTFADPRDKANIKIIEEIKFIKIINITSKSNSDSNSNSFNCGENKSKMFIVFLLIFLFI